MKSTEVLTQLKTLLGMEVKLEEMKLDNGTVLEAEKFESGSEVFIKTEDEKIALPEGIYDMEDGRQLIVIEEGLIDDVKQKSDEKPEEMSEEVKDQVEETVLEESQEEKEEMGYATKEELGEVKQMVEEIKAMIEEKNQEEEMSAQKQEAEELKEELSKPAAQAIKHSPEVKTKRAANLYAQQRSQTTFDRVLSKISQINN